MSTTTTAAYAIVAGVGPGTGTSLALRFAAAGYALALLARTPASLSACVAALPAGTTALSIPTDVGDEKSVENAFAEIKKEFKGRACAVAVLNASGGFIKKGALELKREDFERGFGVSAFGAFTFSQQSLKVLLEDGERPHPPTLIFTGATASVRGSAGFAAFAAPNWAKRALAQSLAREFGPKGVHVAHVVVDGQIDTPRYRGLFPEKFEKGEMISSEGLAETYWGLHVQPRTAWTWEVDIRPWSEKW